MIRTVLEAWDALSDYTVTLDQSEDTAPDNGEKTIIIATMGLEFDTPFSTGDTAHTAIIEIAVVDSKNSNGTISRNNLLALADINAAIIADRRKASPVIAIHDILPIDAASPNSTGRDVGSISFQWRAEWTTPVDDWTTFSPSQ